MTSVFWQLKGGIDKILDWFTETFLKGSADKCRLITSWKTPLEIEVSKITVISEEKVELLGLFIDWTLIIILFNSATISMHQRNLLTLATEI